MEDVKEQVREVVKQFTKEYVSEVVEESTKKLIKGLKNKVKETLEAELGDRSVGEIERYFKENAEFNNAVETTVKSVKKAYLKKIQANFENQFSKILPQSIPTRAVRGIKRPIPAGVMCAITITAAVALLNPSLNVPPDIPSMPSGPTFGYVGTTYSYSTSARDADGDNLRYLFDWGDGTTTDTNYYPCESAACASHSWSSSGTYYIRIRAIDELGASSDWSEPMPVPIRVNYPSIVSNHPSGRNIPVTTPITVTFSKAMNQASAQSAISTSPVTAGSFRWDGNTMFYTPSSNLAHITTYTVTVGIGARDLAGNSLQSPYSWQFTTAQAPDTTPPSAPIPDDDVPGWNSYYTPTFRWAPASDISGIAGYYYKVDYGSEIWTSSTSITLPPQPDGTHTFYVRAQDYAGNIGSYGSHEFYIDTTNPPAPSPDDGVPGWNRYNTPTFRWAPPGDISGIAGYYYKVDYGSEIWTSSTSITLPPQPDGTHTFYVRAQDYAGNIGSYGSHKFYIDTTNPPAPIPYLEGNILRWSPPSDISGIAGYYYVFDSGSATWTTATSVTRPPLSEGTHYFYVRAVDKASNSGTYGYCQFTILE